ncbi:hypothetical protein LTR66_005035 [Elasticomyces elasticus]|nr:hypothetical protein LTR66_005035 [Elasticomyces elasticus]
MIVRTRKLQCRPGQLKFDTWRKPQFRAIARSSKNNNVLENAHCVVTGGSRGIGLGIAKALALHGAACLLVGKNKLKLESAVQELDDLSLSRARQREDGEERPGPKHLFTHGDINNGTDIWNSVSDAMKVSWAASSPDVLVNAAGVTHSSFLVRMSEAQIHEILQTNLTGTILASRWAAKNMLRNKKSGSDMDHGCIINVASLLGLQGGAGSSVYAASKAGVLGFTRALASELGPAGIRVNAIVPGYVETDMTDSMSAKAREEALARIPLKRFGVVDEIAEAAVLLATNRYANNCVLNLDGGMSAT